MPTATANPPEAALESAHPDTSPAVQPVPTPKSRASRSPSTSASSFSGSPVSLSLDPDTYRWFESEAKKDDRTISKFIARMLKSYVAEKTKKQQEDKNF